MFWYYIFYAHVNWLGTGGILLKGRVIDPRDKLKLKGVVRTRYPINNLVGYKNAVSCILESLIPKRLEIPFFKKNPNIPIKSKIPNVFKTKIRRCGNVIKIFNL